MITRTYFVVGLFFVITMGCGVVHEQNGPRSAMSEIQHVAMPYYDRNASNIVVLSSIPESETSSFRTTVLWGSKDGSGSGWSTSFRVSEAGSVYETFWQMDNKSWSNILVTISSSSILDNIDARLCDRTKLKTSENGGNLHIYTATLGDRTSSFSIHSSSEYWNNKCMENDIVRIIEEAIPKIHILSLPEGCIYVIIRERDQSGRIINVEKYGQ